MKIQTTRFGEIEIVESLIFNFESPIIGYNELKRYMLIEHDEKSCFKWLQSLDNPEVAFPVTSAGYFNIEYNFEIQDEDAEKIGLKNAEDLIVLNIASIPADNPKGTTINLKAPIITNISNLKSMQIILPDEKLKIKHPIFGQETPTKESKDG